MPSIKTTAKVVQAIFSLHVVTAVFAFLLLLAAVMVFLRQLKGGAARPGFMKGNRNRPWIMRAREAKKHSSLGPHLCLMSGLFNLMVAYAVQAAIVALRAKIYSPADVTSAYAYGSHIPFRVLSASTSQGKTISILSFVYHVASVLVNLSIIAGIWLHANHMEQNATGLKCPGFISWIWNLLWLAAVAGLGFASFVVALCTRGSGQSAVSYPYIIQMHYYARATYVAYLAAVIAASTSVTIEAVLCWLGSKKNSLVSQPRAKTALATFVFLVLPIVWARNAFYITQAVLLFKNYASWSQGINRALAFLFIIFGELAQLAILALILFGAWSYSQTVEDPDVALKDHRDSASYYARSDVAPTYVEPTHVAPTYVEPTRVV